MCIWSSLYVLCHSITSTIVMLFVISMWSVSLILCIQFIVLEQIMVGLHVILMINAIPLVVLFIGLYVVFDVFSMIIVSMLVWMVYMWFISSIGVYIVLYSNWMLLLVLALVIVTVCISIDVDGLLCVLFNLNVLQLLVICVTGMVTIDIMNTLILWYVLCSFILINTSQVSSNGLYLKCLCLGFLMFIGLYCMSGLPPSVLLINKSFTVLYLSTGSLLLLWLLVLLVCTIMCMYWFILRGLFFTLTYCTQRSYNGSICYLLLMLIWMSIGSVLCLVLYHVSASLSFMF